VPNSWKNAEFEQEFSKLEVMRGVRPLGDGTSESLKVVKVTERWDEELMEHGG